MSTPANGNARAATQALAEDQSMTSPAPESLHTDSARHNPKSPYLLVEDVAARYHSSPRTIRERARLGQVPVLRPSYSRRLLFLSHELDLFDAGAELEFIQLPGGGRRVTVVKGAQ